MTKHPKNDREVLQFLDASLAEDILTESYSDEDIDEELRRAGGDPEAIRQRGLALVADLLEARRLDWQQPARQKIHARQPLLERATPRERMTRNEMLQRLAVLRQDPRQGGQVMAAFRKRKPEAASDEELHELLEEVEILRQLEANDSEEE